MSDWSKKKSRGFRFRVGVGRNGRRRMMDNVVDK